MKKFLGAFILLVILAGCNRSQEITQVHVVAPSGSASYALTWMMAYGDANIVPEIVPNGEALSARVLEGVDVAVVPVNLAAALYNRGAGYVVAGVATWGNLFVLSTDEGISDWDSLADAQVFSFGRGLVPDATLLYLLARHGVDVDIEYLSSPQEVAQVLIGGLGSVGLLAEPAVTQVLNNSDARIILDVQEEWGGGYPQAVVIISEELANRDPLLVEQLLEEMAFSMEWANNYPKELGIAAEALDEMANGGLIYQSIQGLNIRFMDATGAKQEILDYLEILYGVSPELIGGSVPGDGFFLD